MTPLETAQEKHIEEIYTDLLNMFAKHPANQREIKAIMDKMELFELTRPKLTTQDLAGANPF